MFPQFITFPKCVKKSKNYVLSKTNNKLVLCISFLYLFTLKNYKVRCLLLSTFNKSLYEQKRSSHNPTRKHAKVSRTRLKAITCQLASSNFNIDKNSDETYPVDIFLFFLFFFSWSTRHFIIRGSLFSHEKTILPRSKNLAPLTVGKMWKISTELMPAIIFKRSFYTTLLVDSWEIPACQ